MKSLLAIVLCALALSASAVTKDEYIEACKIIKEYNQANASKTTVMTGTKTVKQTVDPAIKQIVKVAKENRNRFEVIKKTVNRYDPAKTNLFARPARASMQTKLDGARAKAVEFYNSFTNELAHSSALSNTLVIVSGQLDAAHAKIDDEIADLEAKVTKYEEYQTKYPLFKALWTALINDAQNRIKILQALTGGE